MERQTEGRTLLLGPRATFPCHLAFCRRAMEEGDGRFSSYSVPPHYISNVLPELAHYAELIHPQGICSPLAKRS